MEINLQLDSLGADVNRALQEISELRSAVPPTSSISAPLPAEEDAAYTNEQRDPEDQDDDQDSVRFIQDRSRRQVTFSKRKAHMMKNVSHETVPRLAIDNYH